MIIIIKGVMMSKVYDWSSKTFEERFDTSSFNDMYEEFLIKKIEELDDGDDLSSLIKQLTNILNEKDKGKGKGEKAKSKLIRKNKPNCKD